MSTFCGLIDEIPYISVDRFDGDNLNSKVFFLSHCHADHMQGLYQLNLDKKLPGPLYTSQISIVFLRKQFPFLKGTSIHALELNCATEINYENENKKYTIVVTMLPARHCPGSVMFLFQTETHNILYTGDFRITHPDLGKHFTILKENPIDVVYLDSTFLKKNYYEFPSQLDSINTIINKIDEWLKMNYKNKIIIHTPAQYGSEYLFTEIYRKLNQKLYIDKRQQIKYIYLLEMDDCITDDTNDCRIFVLNVNYRFSKNNINTLLNCDMKYIRIIKPTALVWTKWKFGDTIIHHENENTIRIAISYHCSLLEIKDFLEFIKPKYVKLNVIPENKYDENIMLKTLEEIYPLNDRNITESDRKLQNEIKEINLDNIFVMKTKKSPSPIRKDTSQKLPKRIKFE